MRKAPQLNGMLMFSDLQYVIAFSCLALVLFIGYTANIYLLPRQRYVLDTVRVLLPKCLLTIVRSRFSADELQIVRGETEDTFIVSPYKFRYTYQYFVSYKTLIL